MMARNRDWPDTVPTDFGGLPPDRRQQDEAPAEWFERMECMHSRLVRLCIGGALASLWYLLDWWPL